jgi:transposase InsO family protein
MCKVLGASKSGYYKWLNSEPSNRAIENQDLTGKIREIHQRSKRTYGSPRIAAELQAEGESVSRPRVARLMKQAGIRSEHKKKYKATTDSKHDHPVAENLLDRNFQPEQIGQAWVSDLTYIWTLQGWLYLTVIMDLATRKVIGWALSKDMSALSTSVAAWKMAIRRQLITGMLIFHSDRGIQYACKEFKELIAEHQHVQQSMSRKGNCWDNAVAESFFKTLKVECLYRQDFETRAQAEIAVFEYIETWYNTNRRHSAIGYMSPEEFEQFLLNNEMVA